ncbi:uncharacterized protein [Dysidea avara]|uniref:uncharacterized protein n=1 Tax=Dysidea avara TaxID=196820 RepID=UPI00331C2187
MDTDINRVVLWSAPRCLSSVFYRSIATLKKTKHFIELFSGAQYFGPDRRSDLYPSIQDSEIDLEGLSVKDLSYETMKKLLTADYSNVDLMFTKELAYCLPESMYQDMVTGRFSNFRHTFLIRDPERALYSNYKALSKHQFNDLYLDPPTGGFHELYKFYKFVKEKKGTTPVIVDAGDLQTYPDETMKVYCEAVGIPFDPKMTSWEPYSCPIAYKMWIDNWFDVLNQSSGFIKTKPGEQKPVPLHELPNEVVKRIENSRECYMEMKKECVKLLI